MPTNSETSKKEGAVAKKVQYSLWKSVLSLEPGLVIHMISVVAVVLNLQDFMLAKACRVNLGFDNVVCDALQSKNADAFAKEEKETQKLLTSAVNLKTVIENAFPIFLVFLIGSWSDKYGRKLPILMVIGAFALTDLLLIICVHQQQSVGVWTVAIVSSLVASLSGNQACFMAASFSYANDNAPTDKLTMRQSITHLSIFLGLTVGLGLGGYAAAIKLPFEQVCAWGFLGELFAFSYFLLLMKNRGQPGATNGKSWFKIIGELFDFKHVRESAHSVLKKRDGNKRLKLWLLLLVHACALFPMFGEMSVNYMFCRLRFGWDGGQYGQFMTYKTVMNFLANFVSMGLLTSMLKLSDPACGIIAMLSNMTAALLTTIAASSTFMYIAPVATLLSGSAMIVPRASISKLISPQETGKVNSFIGSLESVVPLVAATVYTTVYKAFLDVLPGSFNLITAAVTIPGLLVYTWILMEKPTNNAITKKKKN